MIAVAVIIGAVGVLGCLAALIAAGVAYANLEITEWQAEYTDEDWHAEQLDDDGSDGI